jgi:hypothetical protein
VHVYAKDWALQPGELIQQPTSTWNGCAEPSVSSTFLWFSCGPRFSLCRGLRGCDLQVAYSGDAACSVAALARRQVMGCP